MNTFINDLEIAWNVLKSELSKVDSWLVALVKQLWSTDEQLIMSKLNNALTGFATTSIPSGTSSKEMATILLAEVAGQFVGLGAELVYEDILIVVGAVIKAINPPQTTGNAGESSTGDFSGNSSSTTVSPV